MASAMSASGERNPNAIRVSRRILVLVDSISPWDRPWSRAASMAWRCRTMRPANSTNTGMRQRRAQEIHRSRACLPSRLRPKTRGAAAL